MKKQTKKSSKKKFKILAAGDFHGSSEIAKKLANKAEKENVDLVVLTGDITGMVETTNLLKPFKDKHQKVISRNLNQPSRSSSHNDRHHPQNIRDVPSSDDCHPGNLSAPGKAALKTSPGLAI